MASIGSVTGESGVRVRRRWGAAWPRKQHNDTADLRRQSTGYEAVARASDRGNLQFRPWHYSNGRPPRCEHLAQPAAR